MPCLCIAIEEYPLFLAAVAILVTCFVFAGDFSSEMSKKVHVEGNVQVLYHVSYSWGLALFGSLLAIAAGSVTSFELHVDRYMIPT